MVRGSMDKLFFRGFELPAKIGVLPHERKHPQIIIIDLEASIDSQKAAKSDALTDTVDYTLIKATITNIVNRQHYQLIETLANRIADALIDQFSCHTLKLTLSKPDIFDDMDAVGITITRHSRPFNDEQGTPTK